MPDRFTQRIIDHLSNQQYRPVDAEELERQLRVPHELRNEFEQELSSLLEDERVMLGKSDKIQLPPLPSEVEGRIKITARGFGFVVTETPYREGDLFIPAKYTLDAITGDRVRAAVTRQAKATGRGSGEREVRTSGRVVEILERKKTRFTGTIQKRKGAWFVIPDGRSLREPILARDASAKNVKEGDKVVLDIVHYPSDRELAEGVITEVLGASGEPDVETQAVIADFGLATDFSTEVVDEARRAASEFDASSSEGPWENRLDLTGLLTFTIDPPDARDFDDAISLEYDAENNEYELGVHIADVAHFVTMGGPLDKEGLKRGNSTYLPKRVLPMLPELLSNGVCSLQEGVNRFVKSAFVRYDARGRVMGHRYHRSVICSRKRLTYLEAQALIDGNEVEARKNSKSEPDYPVELVDALKCCDKLARAIRKGRFKAGMLRLELPDSELVFDDDGHVIDAVPEDDAFTHTIIEMFMVAGNEAVAWLFAGLEIPLLRRIHPDPDLTHIDELREYARLVRFQMPQEPDRSDLQSLIDVSRGTPYERAVHFAILKTFTKACYSPALIGHFALASEHYAHFTSPIRRYPDLTVHRALDGYLDATENGARVPGGKGRRKLANALSHDDRCLGEEPLARIGQQCSETEVNSEQAERSLRSFLILQFLQQRDPGETYSGIITGVTSNGALFVMLDRYLADGMVTPENMPGQQENGSNWNLDRTSGRLFAARSGASIGIGDVVEVQIESIDLASREMNLTIVSYQPTKPPAEGSTSGPRQKRDKRGSKSSRNKGSTGKSKGYKMGRRGRRSN
ncbi:MAG: VacB/RNase II family 3'-5' exoribonuclease [Phycisphaerales bacterium]|nr:VacB/RNase II family 3'-5' exoribonuclease [Phycisphaerales bacterium]